MDFNKEVAPFLGRCLASLGVALAKSGRVGRARNLAHALHAHRVYACCRHCWCPFRVDVSQGTGGFGAVYEAQWRGRSVAVKRLPPCQSDQPAADSMYAALLREIELASKFCCDRWGRAALAGKGEARGDSREGKGVARGQGPASVLAVVRATLTFSCPPRPCCRLVQVFGACTADREHVCLIMELMQGGFPGRKRGGGAAGEMGRSAPWRMCSFHFFKNKHHTASAARRCNTTRNQRVCLLPAAQAAPSSRASTTGASGGWATWKYCRWAAAQRTRAGVGRRAFPLASAIRRPIPSATEPSPCKESHPHAHTRSLPRTRQPAWPTSTPRWCTVISSRRQVLPLLLLSPTTQRPQARLLPCPPLPLLHRCGGGGGDSRDLDARRRAPAGLRLPLLVCIQPLSPRCRSSAEHPAGCPGARQAGRLRHLPGEGPHQELPQPSDQRQRHGAPRGAPRPSSSICCFRAPMGARSVLAGRCNAASGGVLRRNVCRRTGSVVQRSRPLQPLPVLCLCPPHLPAAHVHGSRAVCGRPRG